MEQSRSLILTFVLLSSTATFLSGCYSQEYVYPELVSDNVRVTETGDPPNSRRRWFGEDIPTSYELIDDDVDLTFSVGREPWVPDLAVRSSIPIVEVLVKECGYVIARDPYESVIFWVYDEHDVSCVEIGESLTIDVTLEDVPKVITVEAVVSNSGLIVHLSSM